MAEKKDLLVEIGLEELPHSFIPDAASDFKRLFLGFLKAESIGHGMVLEYCTPRRLALLIKDVNALQETGVLEKKGPSVEKAYLPGGKPTEALKGFLRSNKAKEEEIVIRESGGGKYVFLVRQEEALETETLLPAVLGKTLSALAFRKAMKWESSGFMFARPIRWLVFLFGEDVVPFGIADASSSRFTSGHRAYSGVDIELASASEYEKKLLEVSVVPDRAKRMEHVKESVLSLAGENGLEVPRQAFHLFERNADLTEYPHAVLCSFDEHFLELPKEVLMSEMMEHQHYFPLFQEHNKLSSHFIAVSNIKDNSESSAGYERVLKARLNDGKFFYIEDKKKKLEEYSPRLATLTFHEKLGMMDEKVERILAVSKALAEMLGLDAARKETVETTARLCKNDLVTLMVGEFPDLQGIMGYYYARESGYPEEVARGIKEHYEPRFAGDSLPQGIAGAAVGIADRLDTIVGIFSIGLTPKGSKDPFGLRRKVLAVIRIIIGMRFSFSLRELIKKTAEIYGSRAENALVEIEGFFRNRVRSIFEDMGFSYDEIDASLQNVLEDVHEAYRRVSVLHEMRGDGDFADLLISFKRMANIVRDEEAHAFAKSLLIELEEKGLFDHFQKMRKEILESVRRRDYREVYRMLSTFKPFVDNFFDRVLVMEENLELRHNRIGLLKQILNVFSDIIDFSKIVQAGE